MNPHGLDVLRWDERLKGGSGGGAQHEKAGGLGEVAEHRGDEDLPARDLSLLRDRRCGRIHSGRPIRSQIQPTMTAVARPAMSRAHTIVGSAVKATAVVQTSTIGLMAGADSKKASAADGLTPAFHEAVRDGTRTRSRAARCHAARARHGDRERRVVRQQPIEDPRGHERN